jgi:hypothetical protein
MMMPRDDLILIWFSLSPFDHFSHRLFPSGGPYKIFSVLAKRLASILHYDKTMTFEVIFSTGQKLFASLLEKVNNLT